MGYTTNFSGRIAIDPPLSEKEIEYLREFANSRRMERRSGPYTVDGRRKDCGVEDVIKHNDPPPCQPGLWCQWVPLDGGAALEWDGNEKFYKAHLWMAYLRTHFIGLNAAKFFAPDDFDFLKPHAMSGTIMACGEDAQSDIWQLRVDGDGAWFRAGEWSALGLLEVFGISGQYEDEDCDDDYVRSGEALLAMGKAGMVDWPDAWDRVPDFAIAEDQVRFEALACAKELGEAANEAQASHRSKSL